MTRAGRAPFVAFAVLVVLAGCSGGGGEDRESDATRETRTDDTTESATDSASPGDDVDPADGGTPADRDLAARAMLGLDDLPDGWRMEEDADARELGVAAFERLCGGLVEERAAIYEDAGGRPADAYAVYRIGDAGLPIIRHLAAVFPDASLAGRAYELAASDDYRGCFMRAFGDPESAPASDVVYGEPVGTPLRVAPVGDEASGLRVTVPVTSAGAQLTGYFDLVVIRTGRVVHELVFGSADLLPLEDEVRDDAVEAAADTPTV